MVVVLYADTMLSRKVGRRSKMKEKTIVKSNGEQYCCWQVRDMDAVHWRGVIASSGAGLPED
jgi:hypothetical protein